MLLIAHSVISAEKEQEEHPAEEDFDPKDPEYNKFYESVAAASAAVKNREDPYGFHFDYEEGNKGPSGTRFTFFKVFLPNCTKFCNAF